MRDEAAAIKIFRPSHSEKRTVDNLLHADANLTTEAGKTTNFYYGGRLCGRLVEHSESAPASGQQHLSSNLRVRKSSGTCKRAGAAQSKYC